MFDPKLYDKSLEAIRKAYGSDAIAYGSDKPVVARIPTGSVVLDWMTGGGFPMGRWCHFYGGYASAKTLTGWSAIKNAQDAGYTCAYYNIENQFDKVWAAQRGIDVDKLIVVDRTKIEDVGEILETLMASVNIHVIDSVGASVSQDELAGDIRDWNPGIAARAWGKVVRRANARHDEENNMLIFINHAKESFGRQGGEEPGGAKAINFFSSLSLHFRKSSWLFYDKNGILSPDAEKKTSMNKDIQPHGIEFMVRATKNRVAREENQVGRFRLDFRTGQFDEGWTLASAIPYFGLAEKSGSWYTLPNGQKVQGENGLREVVDSDQEFRQTVINKIMENV